MNMTRKTPILSSKRGNRTLSKTSMVHLPDLRRWRDIIFSAPQQSVDGERSRAAAKQYQHHRRPLQVRRPGFRVDEDLDHRRHAEEDEYGKAGEKPEHKQNRTGDLDRERHGSRDLGRKQRHAVFLGEKL